MLARCPWRSHTEVSIIDMVELATPNRLFHTFPVVLYLRPSPLPVLRSSGLSWATSPRLLLSLYTLFGTLFERGEYHHIFKMKFIVPSVALFAALAAAQSADSIPACAVRSLPKLDARIDVSRVESNGTDQTTAPLLHLRHRSLGLRLKRPTLPVHNRPDKDHNQRRRLPGQVQAMQQRR